MCQNLETCLRLMNSRFCIIWAGMNHFETRLMVLSQKVETKLLRMAQLKNFDEKKKKKSKMVKISSNFRLFFFEMILTHRYSTTSFLQATLNFELKKMNTIIVPTQILLTIMGYIDHSLRCKLDIYVMAHTKQKPCATN